MKYDEIIKKLESLKNPKNIEGMARFGIRPKTKVLGIPIPELRKIAKEIGKNHELALKLWDSKIHEAQILAGFIEEPEKITKNNLKNGLKILIRGMWLTRFVRLQFDKTKFVPKIIFEFAKRKEEFVKRTAFTLICCLTVHDKKMPDKEFYKIFSINKKSFNR